MGIRHAVMWFQSSYLYRTAESEGRRWRFKSLNELERGPRSLLFGLVFLLVQQAPTLTGRVDADAILQHKDCLLLGSDVGCYLKRLTLSHLFEDHNRSAAEQMVVYAIPSGNLASLKFSGCAHEGADSKPPTTTARKYATPNFRHDAGEDTRNDVPTCLVYLGATSSTHFLADLGDDDKVSKRGEAKS